MRQTLRPYQAEVIADLRESFARHRAVVCQLPTGAGKTTVAAAVAERALERGMRVWMVAHRRQLVKQAYARMQNQGLPTGIYQAGDSARVGARIQVIGIDTFNSRLRSGYELPPRPDLIIPDEAHHAVSSKWQRLFEYAPEARVLGLTATPYRLDGNGLGAVFKDVVVGPTPRELLAEGYLCDVQMWSVPGADLSKVKKRAGDYARGQLADAMGAVVGDVAQHYMKLAAGKQAVCFAVNREHSKAIVEGFLALGVPAAHLDFESSEEERDRALRQFARGDLRVLSNVELFTEGFDMPATEVCIMARPTLSEALFVQMVGRALRPAEGKPFAIIIDHAGNLPRHGHPLDHRPADLTGRPAKERKEAEKLPWVCEKCFAFNEPEHRVCKHCEAERPVNRREVQTEEGTLQRWQPSLEQKARLNDTPLDERRAVFFALDAQRKRTGHKAWWSSYQYRNRFGVLPHDDGLFSREQRRQYWEERRRGGG